MPKVIVLHSYYGCDTGCCGHVVEVDGKQVGRFDFGHPDSRSEDHVREYARALVTEQFGAEHVADIDWDESIITDD